MRVISQSDGPMEHIMKLNCKGHKCDRCGTWFVIENDFHVKGKPQCKANRLKLDCQKCDGTDQYEDIWTGEDEFAMYVWLTRQNHAKN